MGTLDLRPWRPVNRLSLWEDGSLRLWHLSAPGAPALLPWMISATERSALGSRHV